MRKVARIALSLSALLAVATAAKSAGPKPTVTATDVTVAEGQVAEVVLTLSAPSAEVVVVNYETADRSADEGVDYAAGAGPVLFFPGETTKTILVPTYEDFDAEKAEVFTVRIKSGQVGTPGGPIKVTILNQ